MAKTTISDDVSESHIRLIEKICWYYYCEDLTQERIAKILHLTRQKVIKLLEDGRARGIVSFHINRISKSCAETETRLLEMYGLEDVYVIPDPDAGTDFNQALAKAASNYINARLHSGCSINIGYGHTVGLAVNFLAATCDVPWNAVSLTGGVNNYLPNNSSDIFKARLYLYPAPLMLDSPAIRDELMKQKDLRWISKMAQTASMTLFSAGSLTTTATVIRQGLFEQSDFHYLQGLGAVGDILGHFVNKDGQIVDPDTDALLISTPLEVLKDMPKTILVAGGAGKVTIIKAVLRAKLCRVLIIDESTAEMLINSR